MNTIQNVSIPASKAVGQITMTIRVTGLKVLAVRMWLGLLLMKLGARVIGVGVEVKD